MLLFSCAPFSKSTDIDNTNYAFKKIEEWGGIGTDNGEMQRPFSISISYLGNVYIADYGNDRIDVFDKKGKFIQSIGTRGNDDGEFIAPKSVVVNAIGRMYVSDFGNNRIVYFNKKNSSSGFSYSYGGSYTTADGVSFNQPAGITVYNTTPPYSIGGIFVCDTGNNRVVKIDDNGTFLWSYGTFGVGVGNLNTPSDVAVSSDGMYVYVSDTGNKRVVKLDDMGNYITAITGFSKNLGIAVDNNGYLYVVDSGKNSLLIFSSKGEHKATYLFQDEVQIVDVAIDLSGYIYVLDNLNAKIIVLKVYL